MEKSSLKKWMDKNCKNIEDWPKTRAEADAKMRADFTPVDALDIAELETFANDGKNKVYMATYANCLLKARKTGNYAEVNRFRRKIGMVPLP